MSQHVTTLLVQGAGAFFIGVVFAHFRRAFQHAYLRQWTASWFATAVMLFAVAGINALRDAGIWTGSLYVGLNVTAWTMGLLRLVWLLFGAYEITTGREVPADVSRRSLSMTAALGVFMALVLVGDGTFPDPAALARVVFRAGFVAIAYGAAAT